MIQFRLVVVPVTCEGVALGFSALRVFAALKTLHNAFNGRLFSGFRKGVLEMAKMSKDNRKMIRRWLKDVVQELIAACRADEGKSGFPALRDALDTCAHVVSYEITSAIYLEDVRIGYRDFYVDTHDGGWVGFYYTGHYNEHGYRDKDPEMVKMKLPREHNTAICNAIRLFASDQWRHAIARYGANI